MWLKSKGPIVTIALVLLLSISCSLFGSGSETPAPSIEDTPQTPAAEQPDTGQEPAEPQESVPQPADTTPAEAVKPSVEGPWLILRTPEMLYALNADGSGPIPLLELFHLRSWSSLDQMVAPAGRRLAFITSETPEQVDNLQLNVYTLLDNAITQQIDLVTAIYEPDSSAQWGDPALEAAHTLVDLQSFAWSPNGTQLAFMGVIEGPTADLYLYDFATETLSRLTDGPSQGTRPSWSPDGALIAHTGLSTMGTGAGYAMEGIWAARVDDNSVEPLYPLPEHIGDELIRGWISPVDMVVSSWSPAYGDFLLRVYTIDTGETSMLHEGPFTAAVLDGSSTILVYVDRYSAEAGEDTESGLFLIHIPTGTRTILDMEPSRMVWSPEGNRYIILSGSGNTAMTPQGAEISLPAELISIPAFLPGTDRWAAAQGGENPGLWVVRPDGSTVRLSEESCTGVSWTPSGDLIAFGPYGLFISRDPLLELELISDEVYAADEAVWMYRDSGAGEH